MGKGDDLAKAFRVTDGKQFRLKEWDPGDTRGFKSREKAQEALTQGIARLFEDQDKLYAQDRWALLLIFQAMDAAGKDSTIKHVMSGVNPQGCQVYSFKHPSTEELDHDFLWRTTRALPERGRIGIFNRSYYEEVLIVRVHPEILHAENIPQENHTEDIWESRFRSIREYERHLHANAESAPLGLEAIEGSAGLVLERIDMDHGLIKIDGELWSARPYDATQVFEAGDRVRVIEVRGATALVWKE